MRPHNQAHLKQASQQPPPTHYGARQTSLTARDEALRFTRPQARQRDPGPVPAERIQAVLTISPRPCPLIVVLDTLVQTVGSTGPYICASTPTAVNRSTRRFNLGAMTTGIDHTDGTCTKHIEAGNVSGARRRVHVSCRFVLRGVYNARRSRNRGG